MGSLQDYKDRVSSVLLPLLSQYFYILFSCTTLQLLNNFQAPQNLFKNNHEVDHFYRCRFGFFFASAHAIEVEEDGEARLGFISVGTGGDTTLTFNATSIQNAIILGLFILVLGALVLPLFGVAETE